MTRHGETALTIKKITLDLFPLFFLDNGLRQLDL